MNLHSKGQSPASGFSLLEALVVVAIFMVVLAISVPYLLQTYRTYQLNSATSQVASVLQFARYEAIRQNKPITFYAQQTAGGQGQIWTDSIGSGVLQRTDQQALLTNGNVLAIGTVPNTAAIATALGGGALTGVAPTNGTITFDQRGAVVGPAVYAICLGNTAFTAAGYRAVVLLPSGSIQQWSADRAGNWHQSS